MLRASDDDGVIRGKIIVHPSEFTQGIEGEEAAGALFGLDLEQAQVDRGRAFVAGIIERAGEDGLRRLWEPVRNLPTPAEVAPPVSGT